jgi:hypothetical protein
MKKVIRKAKETGKVAWEHKLKILVSIVVISSLSIWFFWQEILITANIFFEEFLDNWWRIGLLVLFYKIVQMSIFNLVKRFAINKSMDRFKKTIIYSEMDELFLISYSLIVKKISKNKYVIIFLGSRLFKVIMWLLTPVIAFFAFFETGAGAYIVGKVFAANFWTAILAWISNIPGLFTLLGLGIWIWIENKLPWIPRFYNLLYSVTRKYFGKYWVYVEKVANFFLDIFYKFDMVTFHKMGLWFDIRERNFIRFMKCSIYKSVGKRNYKRYMRIVETHNTNQIAKKLEKERLERVRRFTMLRKRAKILKRVK